MSVRSEGKAPMTVDPTVCIGFALGGLLIDAAQPLENNALLLLLFVPDRAFSLVHHLVGTDHPVPTQAQEIAEK
jgi:hypothetical protein